MHHKGSPKVPSIRYTVLITVLVCTVVHIHVLLGRVFDIERFSEIVFLFFTSTNLIILFKIKIHIAPVFEYLEVN